MAIFTKKTWTNRSTEFPTRRRLTPTGTADVYTVTREEGTIYAAGDAFEKTAMEELEERIKSGFDAVIAEEIATAADQTLVSTGVGAWAVKSLAQFKDWLGITVAGVEKYFSDTNYEHPLTKSGGSTLALTDNKGMIRVTAAAAFVIPPQSSVAWKDGTSMTFVRDTTGDISFAPSGVAVVKSVGSKLKIGNQNGVVVLRRLAQDYWVLFGDLKA